MTERDSRENAERSRKRRPRGDSREGNSKNLEQQVPLLHGEVLDPGSPEEMVWVTLIVDPDRSEMASSRRRRTSRLKEQPQRRRRRGPRQ